MLYIREGRSLMGLSMNKLKEFREKAGLTQDRLAGCVRVSRQTINSIEAGRYVPSLELALKLGRVFGCRVEDLFGIPEVDDAGQA
jgi:putative transcriptional regulator